ncbi:MAG: hypothetical protein QXO47_08745 [Thermoproteota archaeon]|nr:hypothetical protein [Candidatus Brockarchaeota archaeon]
MEEYERRRRIPWRRILKAIVIMIAAASLIVVGWGLFNLTLVTTEVGYITIIIDPLAGSISVKGDGVSAQWFFFQRHRGHTLRRCTSRLTLCTCGPSWVEQETFPR